MTTGQQTKQLSFSQAEYVSQKKLTRRDKFPAEMEGVVPRKRLIAVVEPYYPKSGKRDRSPIGLERMLRMYFVQQWYALSDEAVEDALCLYCKADYVPHFKARLDLRKRIDFSMDK